MRQPPKAWAWRTLAALPAGSLVEAAASAKESEWLSKDIRKGRSRDLLPRS
ncbi:hypothetical protein G5B47_05695 [Paenibacillus sp. 7124]|uniref:Uncharacterized protein n=1 Tax=Paenibacillus apii TaxID=1850370 RepID=A0A6M1PNL7_9BACL|nr:hypothetical protein [Paenibacillus apii]NGM81901.1 hypothetical protein [Paenibacillus apii]NJJ40940.1 hypothetical protein [Paenibacillus apii]